MMIIVYNAEMSNKYWCLVNEACIFVTCVRSARQGQHVVRPCHETAAETMSYLNTRDSMQGFTVLFGGILKGCY